MILAIDVQYDDCSGYIAGVWFDDWQQVSPSQLYTAIKQPVAPYESGAFYKRELPCILHLLDEHDLKPDFIIVDGFVTLGTDAAGESKAGLGQYLYDALNGDVCVVGVAKNLYKQSNQAEPVFRGESGKPLYITAAGMELTEAVSAIQSMHGDFRMPTLLKHVDSACRKMLL